MTDQHEKKHAFAYGGSIPFMNQYSKDLLAVLRPCRIADLGAGAGKYGRFCRELEQEGRLAGIHLTAVEGCGKTCDFLRESEVYDEVCHELLENWLDQELAKGTIYDLITCGDVLEHLTRRECFRAIDKMLRVGKSVLIQVPLRNLEQDAFEGNPLEEHKAYLLEDDFEKRYVVAEKHTVLMPCHQMMMAWIIGKKKFRWQDIIKKQLLIWGGGTTYRVFKKFHISPEIESDFWRERLGEFGKKDW
ncbi:MAG: class I SAM-dependent methyltransferase [Planctomycetia bacterium]|nr:class I SAM-dependent methyltransferase [Planctomycetia bacterium]